MELVPAYGRDYKSKTAMLADFNANKDFKIANGPYTNKSDLMKLGVRTVLIRYNKLRRVASVVVPSK